MKDFREWHNSDVAKLLSPPILKIRNQIKAIGSKIFSIFVENRIYYEEKIYIICTLCLLFIVASCGLKKQVSVNGNYASTQGKILIIQTNQYLPTNIYRIGSIVVGESGLTPSGNCTYEACMQVIEEESRKVGAQLVYLVKVVEPNITSTCYNITAELYRYDGN